MKLCGGGHSTRNDGEAIIASQMSKSQREDEQRHSRFGLPTLASLGEFLLLGLFVDPALFVADLGQ